MRLLVNPDDKFLGKLSTYVETQSAVNQNKSTRSKTIHHTSNRLLFIVQNMKG